MKVCTITCHDVYNFGASLQAYALMKYLQSLGHEVEIIDYKPYYLSRHYALFGCGNPKYEKNFCLKLIYNIVKFPKRLFALKNKRIFDKYQNTHLIKTKKRYRNNDELKKELPSADAYICGSDQIWNPLFPNGRDKAFYLDFVPEGKRKISYAASIATDDIPQEYKAFIKDCVSKIDWVSVRETTGGQLLAQLGIKSRQVVDPVFLCEKGFWEEQAKEEELTLVGEKYIFVYDFDKNDQLKEIVIKYAKKNNLKILTAFKSDYATLNLPIKDPNCFLAAIKNAEFVISNSFHATAFSIIFEKQFAVMNRKQKVNTRMQDLLGLLGIGMRSIHDSIPDENINYQQVSRLLANEIKKAQEFLEEALSD